MVHTDPVAHQARECATETRGEPERTDLRGDLVLLLAGAHVHAHECLRAFDRRGLCGVHHIYRRLVRGQQFLEDLVQRQHPVVERERHRTGGRLHDGRMASRSARKIVGQFLGVAQRG